MNFYLLYGTDQSLINQKIKDLIKEIGVDNESVIKYSLSNTLLKDIILEASTVSMFSPKKVVIVNDATIFTTSKDKVSDPEELLEYFKNYNKNSTIIFNVLTEKIDTRKKITKEFSKVGKSIELKKGDQAYLINYTKSYLKDNSYEMGINDISYLVTRSGNNIDTLVNELNKLMAYKLEDKKITRDDIDDLVSSSIEEEIFSLTDAVVKGEVSRSLSLLEEFLQKNYEEIQIIALLANQFRFLFQVKRLTNKGKSQDDIAKTLGVHPYRVKLAISTNYYYQESDYLNYLKKLANLDKSIKLGTIDKRLGLELFLIKKDMNY